MTSAPAHRRIKNPFLLLILLVLLGWQVLTNYTMEKKQTRALQTLTSILPHALTSFRIHPDKTFTDDYSDAIRFSKDELLVLTFLQAIAHSRPYQSEHDRALAQWGMQLRTVTTTVNIGCYIPDLNPGVVVLNVRSGPNYGYFQSLALLRWYQKYGHYWGKVDTNKYTIHLGLLYQKEQYERVMPFLESLTPEKMTSFSVSSRVLGTSEDDKGIEFHKDEQIVTEFFRSLTDLHFVNRVPYTTKAVTKWDVQVLTKASAVTIEFSVYEDSPTMVIGLVDSYAGYTYFQSQMLYQWYQKHSHRWLEPEEVQQSTTAQP